MKTFNPEPYQTYSTEWVIDNPAAGLFLDMGAGKTVCTLTGINELIYDRFEVSKVLVIAPLRVAETTWSDEVEKWAHTRHLRLSKVLGPEKQRIAALAAKADIYIINRENVEWLVEHYKSRWPFDMVVIDELSSFKSPSAKRFKALRRVRPLVKRIVGLTGTPAPNGLLDLWSQVYLLDQGERLGKTFTGYRERYFEPDKRNNVMVFSWRPKPGAEEAIQEKIADICFSLKPDTKIQRRNNIVTVHLSPEAAKQYNTLERDLLLPLVGADIVANGAGVLSNKLLQMANGAVYDENGQAREIHSAKLDALEDVIEAANGRPVLVYYAYHHDLDRLKKRFKTAKVLEGAADIKNWNAGRIPILLAHPASAGHGLNLQFGGNIVVWFGLTWNLEYYQQAIKRLERPGQEADHVLVHHLVAKGTIDEDVMRALDNKAVTQDALLAALKARIEKWSSAA
jgi:SNF2 family DNA or RNA helicase